MPTPSHENERIVIGKRVDRAAGPTSAMRISISPGTAIGTRGKRRWAVLTYSILGNSRLRSSVLSMAAQLTIFSPRAASDAPRGHRRARMTSPMTTRYDPFARGSYPVGVRTRELCDDARDGRVLPMEIWYPASDDVTGRDQDRATCDHYEIRPGVRGGWQLAVRDAPARAGTFPFLAFSHGYGGHRRQSTFLCTHLASHGYVVAAVDHTGNTVNDLLRVALDPDRGRAAARRGSAVADRPADLVFVLDSLATGALTGTDVADPQRAGLIGHSFGGWTALAVTGRDPRVAVTCALAPAGGHSETLFRELDFAWARPVPTLVIAAELDSILPLESVRKIYDHLAAPKRGAVLRRADHLHFCDAVGRLHEMYRAMPAQADIPRHKPMLPMAELCPGKHGYAIAQSLCLAHLDAHLRHQATAVDFLADRWQAELLARGVAHEAW
jgi:predicted dienelactone hydrolase